MGLTDEQSREIEAQRRATGPTRRCCSPALEEVLYRAFPVLDHGFVRVVDYLGADESIVQAARVSYGRGTRKVSDDRGLIRYLMRHRHTTPFEMCEIKFHIKLPMFVARQMIRHRTANVNEYSARYSVLDREFYVPEAGELGVQDASNRQGRGAPLPDARARRILDVLRADAEAAYAHYEEFLGGGGGEEPLARELARINLPVNFYTQWYWKADLHNLLHFLHLRKDAHAQREIRAYADVMGDLVRRWVPLAWEAFEDYRMHALSLSRLEAAIVRRLLNGEEPREEVAKLSKRERAELQAKLGIDLERLA